MKNKDQATNGAALPPHEQDALAFRLAVRRLREELGWSQNQLASELRKLGLEEFSQVAVARLERGERAVKIGEARVIAEALNSTIGKMLEPEISFTRGVQDAYKKVMAMRKEAEDLAKSVSRFERSRVAFCVSLNEMLKLANGENSPEREALKTIHLIVGRARQGIGVTDLAHSSYALTSAIDLSNHFTKLIADEKRVSLAVYLAEVNKVIDGLLHEADDYLSGHEDIYKSGTEQGASAPGGA